MKLTIHQFDLPLKHTFKTSHEARDVQPTMIIELGLKDQFGLGEAVATAYYGYSIEAMIAEVEAQRNNVERFDEFTNPDSFYRQLDLWFPENSFIRCAFDIAANDLYGKLQNKPLYELWGLSIENIPVSNYTIGIASLKKMKEKLIETPWPIYKVKLGTDEDINIVTELRSVTDSPFRVDANCGWGADETIKNAVRLKPLGVEFIEQPLPAASIEDMAAVKKQSVLPLIADENCMVPTDVAKCAPYFHGVNVKLTKCGGLTPARRMLAEAKELGLKTMVGCMTESSVGISAIAHLLPLLDYVDMDGAILLSEDPAEGVWLNEQGIAQFTDRPGTGALLKLNL